MPQATHFGSADEMTAYLEPWEAVTRDRAAAMEAELALEVHPSHVLARRNLEIIAARRDCDDVLCRVEGLGYAVVHMTWSHRHESPEFLRTQVFLSFDEWRECRIKPDHLEYG